MKISMILVIAVVVLLIGGGIYYFLQNSNTNEENSPEDNFQEDNNQEDSGTTHNIEISGFAFLPASLTISRGDIVIWTNEDSTPHTITSDSGDELDSETFRKGETYSHTFNEIGSFDYHCAIHPNMKGEIIVE